MVEAPWMKLEGVNNEEQEKQLVFFFFFENLQNTRHQARHLAWIILF